MKANVRQARLPLAAEIHIRSNTGSAPCWDTYKPHREAVTAVLSNEGVCQDCLFVGAGNANDLALDLIASRSNSVHLVDLDDQALARAHARQSELTKSKLTLHGPVDFTGVLHALTRWAKSPPTGSTLQNELDSASHAVSALLPLQVDFTISVCVLSQIGASLRGAMGPRQYLEESVLRAHLSLLMRMCKPGGRVVVITDVVSSDTYPVDEMFDPASSAALFPVLRAQHNMFTGTDPAWLHRTSASLGATKWHQYEPWLWAALPDRSYLVHAVSFSTPFNS